MAKLYFADLKEAQKVAKKRGKKVYKMYSGEYFVGTYEQAINRLHRIVTTYQVKNNL